MVVQSLTLADIRKAQKRRRPGFERALDWARSWPGHQVLVSAHFTEESFGFWRIWAWAWIIGCALAAPLAAQPASVGAPLSSIGCRLDGGGCGASGLGLTNLNGLTGSSQTFASGTGLTISSVTTTHTFTLHANLQSLAALTGAADKGVYTTGVGTFALYDMSAFARTILDDENGAAVRTTIGMAGGTCTNQFARSIDSAATPTCASVVNADIAAATIDLTTKVTGILPAANMPALTGDVTTSAGAVATTLASIVTAGTCGDTTHSCGLTYDAKGRIAVATNNAISGISGLTTGRVPYAASSTTLADSTAFVASVANDSVAHWTLASLFAGKPGMVIKGAASQTATLTEWQNSSSTVLASVSAAGRMGFAIGTASDSTLSLVSGGTRYGGYGLNWHDGGGGANVGGFTTTIANTYYTVLADQSSSNTGNMKFGSGVQATWSAAANPTTTGGDEDTGIKRLAAAFVGATDGNAAAGSFGASAYYLGTATSAIKWTSGSGSPESAVTAPVGSLYSRTDGGAATSLYVKESGSGNTGWVAK